MASSLNTGGEALSRENIARLYSGTLFRHAMLEVCIKALLGFLRAFGAPAGTQALLMIDRSVDC